MKDLLLFSGGMDSLIAWEYLKRPDCLYIDMGHKYANVEKAAVLKLMRSYIGEKCNIGIADFKLLGNFETEDATIPLRNLYFAMIGVNSGYDRIWIIVQKDEMNIPDRTYTFFIKASALLTMLSGRDIFVGTPFKQMDKTDMVKWYVKSGKDIEKLKMTWACYHPEEFKGPWDPRVGATTVYRPCANCPACFRRFVAMKLNGIEEEWHGSLLKSDIVKTYLERAKKGKNYSAERNKRILDALEVSK